MLHFIWAPYRFHRASWTRYETANHEIVKHARRFFEARIATHVTSFHVGRVTDRPEDVLIGHPSWDPTGDGIDDWMRANALVQGQAGHPNAYVLMPWVPRFPPEWTMPHIEGQLMAARRIFGLCGAIWRERTAALQDDSLQARVRDKLVTVDMGCAAELLPFRGEPRRAPRRSFLHMSNCASYKRFDLVLRSLAGTGAELTLASWDVPPGRYSAGVQGLGQLDWTSLGTVSNGHPEFERFVHDQVDFYIHTSDMDAQATTVLEAAARGVVPLVTPESGFRSPFAIELSDDPAYNRAQVQAAMAMSDDEYRRRAAGLRAQIEREHDWERIFDRIWQVVETDRAADRRSRSAAHQRQAA